MFYDEIHDLFIKRLTQLRLEKGVSSREMSLSLGQNQGYINFIENKRHLPSMSVFFYICEYFEISPLDFFDDGTENIIKTSELYSKIKSLDADEEDAINATLNIFLKHKEKEDK